jgi:hypothetical protein
MATELMGRSTSKHVHDALVGWLLETLRTAEAPSPFLTLGDVHEVADGTGEPAIELEFYGRRWRIRVSEIEG